MNKLYEYYPNGWVNLMEVTKLNVTELHSIIISLGFKISKNTFISWRNTGSMKPEALTLICNHFHFPIHNFVIVNGNKPSVNKCRIFSEDEWEDITFTPSNIIRFCTDKYHIDRQKAISLIGCSSGTYDKLRKYPETNIARLTFSKLIEHISNAKIYAGDVFTDHNTLFPNVEKVIPYYDKIATEAYYAEPEYQPQQSTPPGSTAAEQIFDIFQFVKDYITSDTLPGDNTIYQITGRTLNEIASLPRNLQRKMGLLEAELAIIKNENFELKKENEILKSK